jgi:hypothetical protein
MTKEFLCVQQFQCARCLRTCLSRNVVEAESLEAAEARMRKAVATCKACGLVAGRDEVLSLVIGELVHEHDVARA